MIYKKIFNEKDPSEKNYKNIDVMMDKILKWIEKGESKIRKFN
jgi:hypothetical protein